MTDRELLELAAKAAGIAGWRQCGPDNDPYLAMFYDDHDEYFNPLFDDGDALRLAVNLRIHLTNSAVDAWASTEKVMAIEPLKNDPCAATRRAIVRAAAEIGKAMS